MNITLRKANALQTSITETLRSVKVELTTEFNEFQDPAVELQKRNIEVFEADTRRSNLLLAQFTIRGLVGSANANAGVDAKLTQAAYIDKRLAQLADLTAATEQTEMSVVIGKLEKIKNRKEESRASLYGRDDTVTTGVLSKDQIQATKAMVLDLKKQKQKLNDEILELNVRTEITLTDDVTAILQSEGLI